MCFFFSQVRTPGTPDEGKTLLKAFIEEHVIMYQRGRRIYIKPFSKFQNMLAMVGYTMKDDGKSHYRFHAVNISESDLEHCRSNAPGTLTSLAAVLPVICHQQENIAPLIP